MVIFWPIMFEYVNAHITLYILMSYVVLSIFEITQYFLYFNGIITFSISRFQGWMYQTVGMFQGLPSSEAALHYSLGLLLSYLK